MADMPAGTTFCTLKGRLAGFTTDGPDFNDLPDLVALGGTITCVPVIPGSGYVVNGADGTLIYGEQLTQRLAVDGSFSIKLVASDSPNLTPSGWPYQVSITPQVGSPIRFKFIAQGGKTLNIADLLAGTAAFPTLDASLVEVGDGPPDASTLGNFYLDASTDDVWINA